MKTMGKSFVRSFSFLFISVPHIVKIASRGASRKEIGSNTANQASDRIPPLFQQQIKRLLQKSSHRLKGNHRRRDGTGDGWTRNNTLLSK